MFDAIDESAVLANFDYCIQPPPKKRGRPRSTGASASQPVPRTPSTASVGKEPAKNTIAWGVQRLEATRAEIRATSDALVKRVDSAETASATCTMEIRTLAAKLERLDSEVRALREERRNVYDTGSESGESPVRNSGNKRKASSQGVASPSKRTRVATAPARPKANPVPLEQRISAAPPVVQPSQAAHVPPASRGPPHPLPSSSKPHQTSASSARTPYPTAPVRAGPPSAPRAMPSFSMHPNQGVGDQYAARPQSEGSRGRGGNPGYRARGRGGSAKGKGRNRPQGTDAPLDDGRLTIGPLHWGTRSRDLFIQYCHQMEADGYGPTAGNFGSARDTAELMASVWEAWSSTKDDELRDSAVYLPE